MEGEKPDMDGKRLDPQPVKLNKAYSFYVIDIEPTEKYKHNNDKNRLKNLLLRGILCKRTQIPLQISIKKAKSVISLAEGTMHHERPHPRILL
jgi:hypothetical protein